LKLSFYEQLKLINWIRKEKVDSGLDLNIMEIRERILGREWDNVQYYFPTYADDHLLQMLDFDDDIEEDEYNYIIAEDGPDFEKIKKNSILKNLVSDLQKEQIKEKKIKKYSRKHTTDKPKQNKEKEDLTSVKTGTTPKTETKQKNRKI